MPKINHNHYQILGIISELEAEQDVDEGVPLADIADAMGVSVDTVERVVRGMVHPSWDGGNPWLERAPRGGVWLTSDGGQVFAAAHVGPETKANAWIDAMRWPWREEDSQRENVAIPSFRRGPIEDPERSAFRHADHLLPRIDEIDEDEMRRAWRRMFD